MATTAEASTTRDRRARPQAVRRRRRWQDDPALRPIVDNLLLLLSRDTHAARDSQDMSQEQFARAAGLSAQAVSNIEKMKDDPHLSTIVRVAFAAGCVVDIRFRRVAQPYNHGLRKSAP